MISLDPLEWNSDGLCDALGELERKERSLARMTRMLSRVFRIRSAFAPGLVCLGAEIPLDAEMADAYGGSAASVTGTGETYFGALTGLLGEATEFLSQLERIGDVRAGRNAGNAASLLSGQTQSPPIVANGWIGQAMAEDGVAGASIETVHALRASQPGEVALPADFCLRRPRARRRLRPVGALSSGCAAARFVNAAGLRALLELLERDSAALWWLGGSRPRAFDLSHPAILAGGALLGRLRQGHTGRRTRFLDLTTDFGVPVVAAVSMNSEGREFACGLACRIDLAAAIESAILEMCQMELASPIAAMKRDEQGEAALSGADRQHLMRAAFNAATCPLFDPSMLSSRPHETPGTDGPGADLKRLAALLRENGIETYLVNLTRADFGVPVVRAIAPDLQPFATGVVTARLRDTFVGTGGGSAMTGGTPLF